MAAVSGALYPQSRSYILSSDVVAPLMNEKPSKIKTQIKLCPEEKWSVNAADLTKQKHLWKMIAIVDWLRLL